MDILIKNAKLICTMDDNRTKLEGGDIRIHGNSIVAVGTLEAKDNEQVIDASHHLVLPGFVNTHHHLYQTLTRNLPACQDAELFDWIRTLYPIWARIDQGSVYLSGLAGLCELMLTGCTTASDHFYLFPRSATSHLFDYLVKAGRDAGIRFHPCRGSMSRGQSKGGLPPDHVVQTEEEIIADCQRVIEQYHDASPFSMCRVVLAPCSPFSVSEELLVKTRDLAEKHHLSLHTHVAETIDEENYCLEVYGQRPLAYMHSVGWTGDNCWYAHCVHLNDQEIELMAETGTGVAHCPVSNLRLASGIAPIRKMMDAGVKVGLAVDGSASNDSSDILGEVRQCTLIHRIKSGVKSMPAEDALWLATRGGAAVLGRDDIGSIEAGKAADLALFNLNRLEYAGAMHDPLAALVFCGYSHQVDYLFVDGNLRVKGGELVDIDSNWLLGEMNKTAERLVG